MLEEVLWKLYPSSLLVEVDRDFRITQCHTRLNVYAYVFFGYKDIRKVQADFYCSNYPPAKPGL